MPNSTRAALAVGAAAGLACWLIRRRAAAAELALRDVSARRNALGLELMSGRNKLMHSAESVAAGRCIKVSPTDVFVVTYPKCGTT